MSLSRTYRSVSRLSLGLFLLGLFGTTESTPLTMLVFRLLGAVVQSFQALAKRLAKDQLFLHKSDGHPQGQAETSDRGGALAMTEPSSNRPGSNFRGIWVQGKPGARFQKKRLMRMNHRLPHAGDD